MPGPPEPDGRNLFGERPGFKRAGRVIVPAKLEHAIFALDYERRRLDMGHIIRLGGHSPASILASITRTETRLSLPILMVGMSPRLAASYEAPRLRP